MGSLTLTFLIHCVLDATCALCSYYPFKKVFLSRTDSEQQLQFQLPLFHVLLKSLSPGRANLLNQTAQLLQPSPGDPAQSGTPIAFGFCGPQYCCYSKGLVPSWRRWRPYCLSPPSPGAFWRSSYELLSSSCGSKPAYAGRIGKTRKQTSKQTNWPDPPPSKRVIVHRFTGQKIIRGSKNILTQQGFYFILFFSDSA